MALARARRPGLSVQAKEDEVVSDFVSQVQIDLNGRPATPRHRAQQIENTSWRGRPALLLDGFAFFPEWELEEGVITVDIGAEGAAYCGVVFHGQDPANFELVYAQPHTSGRWDALQYDPVFRGSNTWQLYHGPGAQQATRVPMGEWFTLEVAFDAHRACARVGDGEPLIVPRLAHGVGKGFIGIWTYQPAYFSNLRVVPGRTDLLSGLDNPSLHGIGTSQSQLITEWFVEGFGKVECEPNGVLNLNRYLPVTVSEARLVRRLVAEQETRLELTFGFSDVLTLGIDDKVLYQGEHLYAPERQSQGYVGLDHKLKYTLLPGEHTLIATLSRTEYFGWGMIMSLAGAGVRLKPAVLG